MNEPRLIALSPAPAPRKSLVELKTALAIQLSLAARLALQGRHLDAKEARTKAGQIDGEISKIRSKLKRKPTQTREDEFSSRAALLDTLNLIAEVKKTEK